MLSLVKFYTIPVIVVRLDVVKVVIAAVGSIGIVEDCILFDVLKKTPE